MCRVGGFTGVASALVGITLMVPSAVDAQEVVGTTVLTGRDGSRLEVELSDGDAFDIQLADGIVYVNSDAIGRYEPGGPLTSAWRDLLRQAGDPEEFSEAWQAFASANYAGTDASALAALVASLPPAFRVEISPATESAASSAEAVVPQDGTASTAQEIVSGGLIVELSEIEGSRSTLERLLPGLSESLAETLRGGALRLVIDADEYRLPEGAQLDRSLALVETDGTIAGTVAGHVLVVDGSVVVESGARIEGDLLGVDAEIENQGATILGEFRDNVAVPPIVVRDQVREAIRTSVRETRTSSRSAFRSFMRDIGRGAASLLQTVAGYLVFAVIGVLLVYFFRGHLETMSDTVAFSFGRSFLAGLAAEILFFPVLLVLVVLVLTWIAIPFYVLGFAVASLLGYLAVAHAAGENLTRHRFPSWVARLRRSNSYYYVLNGLAVLLALFAVASLVEMGGQLLGWAHGLLIAAAWILTWIAATAGMGAVVLSRAGTRRSFARPREIRDVPGRKLGDEMVDLSRKPRAHELRTRRRDVD